MAANPKDLALFGGLEDVLGPAHAILAPADERAFRSWYVPLAKKWGIDANPDNPLHKYDYRAAFKIGAGPDSTGHWPSQFKDDDHPNRFINGIDTKTGKGTHSDSDIDLFKGLEDVVGPRSAPMPAPERFTDPLSGMEMQAPPGPALVPQTPRIAHPLNDLPRDVRPDQGTGTLTPRSVPTAPDFGPGKVTAPPAPKLMAAPPSSTAVVPPIEVPVPQKAEILNAQPTAQAFLSDRSGDLSYQTPPVTPAPYVPPKTEVRPLDIEKLKEMLSYSFPGVAAMLNTPKGEEWARLLAARAMPPTARAIVEEILSYEAGHPVALETPEAKGLLQKVAAGATEFAAQTPEMIAGGELVGGPAAALAREAGGGAIVSAMAHGAGTFGSMAALPKPGPERTAEQYAQDIAKSGTTGAAFNVLPGIARAALPEVGKVTEALSGAIPAGILAWIHKEPLDQIILQTGLVGLLPLLSRARKATTDPAQRADIDQKIETAKAIIEKSAPLDQTGEAQPGQALPTGTPPIAYESGPPNILNASARPPQAPPVSILSTNAETGARVREAQARGAEAQAREAEAKAREQEAQANIVEQQAEQTAKTAPPVPGGEEPITPPPAPGKVNFRAYFEAVTGKPFPTKTPVGDAMAEMQRVRAEWKAGGQKMPPAETVAPTATTETPAELATTAQAGAGVAETSNVNGYLIKKEVYSEKRGDTGDFHTVYRIYGPDGNRAVRVDYSDLKRAAFKARSLPAPVSEAGPGAQAPQEVPAPAGETPLVKGGWTPPSVAQRKAIANAKDWELSFRDWLYSNKNPHSEILGNPSKREEGLGLSQDTHRRRILDALTSGDLSPADYARLHESTYGPLAEFARTETPSKPLSPEGQEAARTEQGKMFGKAKPSPGTVGIVHPLFHTLENLAKRVGLRGKEPLFDPKKFPELAQAEELANKQDRTQEALASGQIFDVESELGKDVAAKFQGKGAAWLAAQKLLTDNQVALETMEQAIGKALGVKIGSMESPTENLAAYRHLQGTEKLWGLRFGDALKVFNGGKNLTSGLYRKAQIFVQLKSFITREQRATTRPTEYAGKQAAGYNARIEQLKKLHADALARAGGANPKAAARAEDLSNRIQRTEKLRDKWLGVTMPAENVNPEGVTAQLAQKQLDQMRKAIGGIRYAQFEKGARELARVWHEALLYTLKGDLISRETYDAVNAEAARTGDYLGPFRILEHVVKELQDRPSPGVATRSVSISGQTVVQHMQGTTKLNEPIFSASILKIAHMVHQVEQNRVAQSVYRLRNLGPDVADVIKDAEMVEIGGKQFYKINGEITDTVLPHGFSPINFLAAGEKRTFLVPTPVADVLTGAFGQVETDLMIRLFRASRNLLRVTATSASPTFVITNPTRDIGTNLVSAEYPLFMGKDFYKDFSRVGRAYLAVLTEGNKGMRESLGQWYASGGSHTTRSAQYGKRRLDLKSAQEIEAKRVAGLSGIERGEKLGATLETVMGPMESTEGGIRLAIFDKAKGKYEEKYGVSTPSVEDLFRTGFEHSEAFRPIFDAGGQSRNATVDFSKGGDVTKSLNTGAPFVNAPVQGMITVAKGAREHPTRFLFLAAAAAAIGVGAWNFNHRTKEIADAEDDMAQSFKDGYFHAILYVNHDAEGNPLPVVVSVRKPEWVQAVTSIPTEFLDWYYRRGGQTGKSAALNVVSNFSPWQFTTNQGEFNPSRLFSVLAPTMIAAPFEVQGRGYDPYRDQEIVSDTMMDRRPEERLNAGTSLGARWLGEKTGTAPVKWDYFAGRIAASPGRYLLRAPELIAGSPTDTRNLTWEEKATRLPLVPGFFRSMPGRAKAQAIHRALDVAEQNAGSERFETAQKTRLLVAKWPSMSGADRSTAMADLKRTPGAVADFLSRQQVADKGQGAGNEIFRRISMYSDQAGERAEAIAQVFRDVLKRPDQQEEFYQQLRDRDLLTPGMEQDVERRMTSVNKAVPALSPDYLRDKDAKESVSALVRLRAENKKQEFLDLLRQLQPEGANDANRLQAFMEHNGITYKQFQDRVKETIQETNYRWVENIQAFDGLLSELEARLNRQDILVLDRMLPEQVAKKVLSDPDLLSQMRATIGPYAQEVRDRGLMPGDFVKIALRRIKANRHREAAD